MTGFIAVMGASHPGKPGFLHSIGMTASFIYGGPLGVWIGLVAFGKFFDLILMRIPLTRLEVSWIGIFLAAVFLIILGNIFVDHLYQFKKGHYGISVVSLVMILIYAIIVYFSAKIPLPWISRLF